MSATLEPRLRHALPRQRPELVEPLARLDRRIRRYVLLEGLAWTVVFIGGWAALSFLFDWGFLFRLCGVDYLRDGLVPGHRAARTLALVVLLVGAIAIAAHHWVWRLSPWSLSAPACWVVS